MGPSPSRTIWKGPLGLSWQLVQLPPAPVALPVVVAAAVSSEPPLPPLPPELDVAVDDDAVLVALPPVPALVALSI